MFHNFLMTTLTPISNTNEIDQWDSKPFTHAYQNKNSNISKTIKKKPKRVRTAFTTDQLRVLEKTFKRTKFIDAMQRQELAKYLRVGDKCVKVWFQNRRMKEKRVSESSNDSSSDILTLSASLAAVKTPSNSLMAPDISMPQLGCVQNAISTTFVQDSMISQSDYNHQHQLAISSMSGIRPQHQTDQYIPQETYTEYEITSHAGNNQSPLLEMSNMSGIFSHNTNVYPTQYYPQHIAMDQYFSDNNEMAYTTNNSEGNIWPHDYGIYYY